MLFYPKTQPQTLSFVLFFPLLSLVQNNQIDDQKSMMEKTVQEQQQQQQQQALRCPRCDSSNTKFCYYNNYSLSQPRHFCKACKRYWTRGGTLRNVPVGGGCRKNKRVKRPSASSGIDGASSNSSAPTSNANPPSQPHLDIPSSTSNHMNPLFFGLSSNPSDVSLSFPRFNPRASNVETVSGYDLQPQLNALGLGFSSGILSNGACENDYRNGFNPSKHIQDVYSIFGSSSSTNTTSPTMASLLSSSFHQQKFMNGGMKETRAPNHYQSLAPFEGLHIASNSEAAGIGMKGVKVEDGQSRMDWNNNNGSCQNQMEQQQVGLSDPSLYWNATNMGAWNDPGNIGSSVTSLI